MTGKPREIWERIRSLVDRRRFDRDLEDELASHIDLAWKTTLGGV
jgi:hypothetical protein